MKLPREILVGPHLYRVRNGRNAERALDGKLGQCDIRASIIDVHPSQSPSQAADTLLHELLHACWDQTAHRADPGDVSAEEEAMVSSLTPILLTMLRANPELVEVLTGAR